MALPTKPIAVRLSGDLDKKFRTLRAEFGALPPSTIMRLVVAAHLAKPLPEQIEIVAQQIRKPGALPSRPVRAGNNATSRLSI